MKTIEINCLECRNCTGDSCKVYGFDADKAVKRCADDSFRNYKARMTREEAASILENNAVNATGTLGCLPPKAKEISSLNKQIEALKEQEIVHCKDCKYWIRTRIGEEELNQCGLAGYFIGERGYCLYGKAGEKE